jgi:pyruvate/2-oxoglutarate/acetoin dehydrogenase E1 component
MILAYHEARSRALFRELDANPDLLLLGGSIALPFNPDDGLLERYSEQILWPPISEFATAATAIGAAMAGLRTLVPISTSSFMFYGWAPIVNEAANVRYLSGGAVSAPATFHIMAGSRRGGAAQHEHTPQAMLQNVAGLRILAPATPRDVDAAFHSALTGDDPTVIVDNIRLATFVGEIDEHPAACDGPRLLCQGDDALIVSYSLMTQHALAAAAELAATGIEVAVLNVPLLSPLPARGLIEATAGHDSILFVDESRAAGSPASHMLSVVAESHPRLATRLLCTAPVPSPFAPHLVDAVVPGPAQIAAAVHALLES